MKNAKERKTELLTGVEELEAMEPMDVEAVIQETSDDIPVDIIEESEGNYASM